MDGFAVVVRSLDFMLFDTAFKKITTGMLFMHMGMCICHSVHMKGRGRLVDSLYPL